MALDDLCHRNKLYNQTQSKVTTSIANSANSVPGTVDSTLLIEAVECKSSSLMQSEQDLP